jgi:hypothetical protein
VPWYFFAGFPAMHRFSSVPADGDLPLGMWLERTGLRRGLLVVSIIEGVIFRIQIIKPLNPTNFAEFENDREWLSRQTKNSG